MEHDPAIRLMTTFGKYCIYIDINEKNCPRAIYIHSAVISIKIAV